MLLLINFFQTIVVMKCKIVESCAFSIFYLYITFSKSLKKCRTHKYSPHWNNKNFCGVELKIIKFRFIRIFKNRFFYSIEFAYKTNFYLSEFYVKEFLFRRKRKSNHL